LSSLDVTVRGHCGHNAEEVSRIEKIASLFLDDFYFLADTHFTGTEYVERVRPLLSLDDDV
jgi:hypothetical protein